MPLAGLKEIHYRPDTQDTVVVNEILSQDIYRLRDRKFQPDDLIIDIGAHIGIFSLAVMHRGAQSVLAFEPDPENFKLLKQNLAEYPGTVFFNAGVWRSDVEEHIYFSGYPKRFTACGTCMPQMVVNGMNRKKPVASISLDKILGDLGTPPIAKRVRLLKIDCEGAEYPILLTSKLLGQVDEIVGETHRIGQLASPFMGRVNFNVDNLMDHLKSEGFSDIETWENTDMGSINTFLTMFSAKRKGVEA